MRSSLSCSFFFPLSLLSTYFALLWYLPAFILSLIPHAEPRSFIYNVNLSGKWSIFIMRSYVYWLCLVSKKTLFQWAFFELSAHFSFSIGEFWNWIGHDVSIVSNSERHDRNKECQIYIAKRVKRPHYTNRLWNVVKLNPRQFQAECFNGHQKSSAVINTTKWNHNISAGLVIAVLKGLFLKLP